MKRRTARRLGWLMFGLLYGSAAVGLLLSYLNGQRGDFVENLVIGLAFFAMGGVGALIVFRRPDNLVGWLFGGIALVSAIAFGIGEQYSIYALITKRGTLPGGVFAAWLSSWMWVFTIGSLLIFLPLLFPSGKLPSPRWRLFAWLSTSFIVFVGVVFALRPQLGVPVADGTVRNPIGIDSLEAWATFLDSGGFFIFIVFALASAVSLILRFRRAPSDQRQQIKWFVYAVAVLAGYMLFSGIAEAIGLLPPEGSVVDDVAGFLAFMAIPVSAGIGILKYRLFDVDIVIKKTVVFGLLAAFMTALYVGIVVGIGTLVAGAGTNRLLNIAAAVIIALAFQPARERARHLANRLVYGKRATPYEILSEFSERMGGAFAVEDLLPTMARILGEGTGANHAMVWLKVGKELRPAASWPEESLPRAAVPVAGEDVPAIANVDAVFAVKHQNELLGALSVTKPRGESLTPEEEKLLSGVASQAALVLRNVRLTAELQAKLEELQASRQRIVAAQDAERRRLERNIHDGAQQQLVALSVKLRLARQLSGRDHDRAEQMLSEVEQETIDALETLRDLARGIYPPLLADQGLPAALTAQARKVPLQVDVEPNGVGRYPQEVEAAVYFCCLEALQNMSKYAKASRAVVRLSAADGELRFQVQDDGVGFDPDRTPRGSGLQNMADRLAALEGTLEVSSRPGEGTTVAGSVPVKAVEPAMA